MEDVVYDGSSNHIQGRSILVVLVLLMWICMTSCILVVLSVVCHAFPDHAIHISIICMFRARGVCGLWLVCSIVCAISHPTCYLFRSYTYLFHFAQRLVLLVCARLRSLSSSLALADSVLQVPVP